MYPNSQRKIWI